MRKKPKQRIHNEKKARNVTRRASFRSLGAGLAISAVERARLLAAPKEWGPDDKPPGWLRDHCQCIQKYTTRHVDCDEEWKELLILSRRMKEIKKHDVSALRQPGMLTPTPR